MIPNMKPKRKNFSPDERRDMVNCCNDALGNIGLAGRLYAASYPNRRKPTTKTIRKLYRIHAYQVSSNHYDGDKELVECCVASDGNIPATFKLFSLRNPGSGAPTLKILRAALLQHGYDDLYMKVSSVCASYSIDGDDDDVNYGSSDDDSELESTTDSNKVYESKKDKCASTDTCQSGSKARKTQKGFNTNPQTKLQTSQDQEDTVKTNNEMEVTQAEIDSSKELAALVQDIGDTQAIIGTVETQNSQEILEVNLESVPSMLQNNMDDGNKVQIDKFKRRLIRAVTRVLQKKLPEDEMWRELKKDIGCDCKNLWDHMRALTLKKLKRLIAAEDKLENISKVARFTMTDWLLFDLVLVHEEIDVIGQISDNIPKPDEPKCLYDLFELVKKHKVELCTGEELTEAWFNLSMEYNSRGRQASPMLLQLRWYQLKEASRMCFYNFWYTYRGNVRMLTNAMNVKPTKLQTDVAKTYPRVITMPFPHWDTLIEQKRVMLAEDFINNREAKRKAAIRAREENDIEIEVIEPQIEIINLEDDSDTEVVDTDNKINDNVEGTGFIESEILEPETVDDQDYPTNIDTVDPNDIMKCEVDADSLEIDGLYDVETMHIPLEENKETGEDSTYTNYNKSTDNDYLVNESEVDNLLPKITSVVGNVSESIESDPEDEINRVLEEKARSMDASIKLVQDQSEKVDHILSNDAAVVDCDTDNTDEEIDNILKEKANNYAKGENRSVEVNVDSTMAEITKISQNITSIEECVPESEELSDTNNKHSTHAEVNEKENIDFTDTGDGIVDMFSLNFVDDGIEFFEDEIGFIDDRASKKITTQADNSLSSDSSDEENEGISKIDLKLLMTPSVYTTKLDDMEVFRNVDFMSIQDKGIIECAIKESKPEDKRSTTDEEIAKFREQALLGDYVSFDGETGCDNDEPLIETESIEERIRVKSTSWLLQKPKSRSYNPIQLCKNPDFNTRLKRLTAGFLSSTRNRMLLKVCKPLTIDLHKAFESKLDNGTMYIEDKGFKSAISTTKNIMTHQVSVVPSAIPGQSIIFGANLPSDTLLHHDDDLPLAAITTTPMFRDPLPSGRNKIVTLPDIAQIRRVNQTLLTAEVSPVQIDRNTNNEVSPYNSKSTEKIVEPTTPLHDSPEGKNVESKEGIKSNQIQITNISAQHSMLNKINDQIINISNQISQFDTHDPKDVSVESEITISSQPKTIPKKLQPQKKTTSHNISRFPRSYYPVKTVAKNTVLKRISKSIEKFGESLLTHDTFNKILLLLTPYYYNPPPDKTKKPLKSKDTPKSKPKIIKKIKKSDPNKTRMKKTHQAPKQNLEKREDALAYVQTVHKQGQIKETSQTIVLSDDEDKNTEHVIHNEAAKESCVPEMNLQITNVSSLSNDLNDVVGQFVSNATDIPPDSSPPVMIPETNIVNSENVPLINLEPEYPTKMYTVNTQTMLPNESRNTEKKICKTMVRSAPQGEYRNLGKKPTEKNKKAPVSNLKEVPHMLVLNTTQVFKKPSQGPIFVDKNKILLCSVNKPQLTNFKFPSPAPIVTGGTPQTSINNIESTGTSNVLLPKGVNLLLLESGELTLSIDPGIELDTEQLAALPPIMSAVQSQLMGNMSSNNITPNISNVAQIVPADNEPMTKDISIQTADDLIQATDDHILTISDRTNSAKQITDGSDQSIECGIQIGLDNIKPSHSDSNEIKLLHPMNISTGSDLREVKDVANKVNPCDVVIATTPITKGYTPIILDLEEPNLRIQEPLSSEAEKEKANSNIGAATYLSEIQNNSESTCTFKAVPSFKTSINHENINAGASCQKTNLSKTILSDLMEMSGISAEDIALGQDSNANNNIPLTNIPLMVNQDEGTINKSHEPGEDYFQFKNPKPKVFVTKSPASRMLGQIAKTRPELNPVTTYSELKHAYENNGQFYKLDVDTGIIAPVNIFIQKGQPSKPQEIKGFIDLTHDVEDNVPTKSSPVKYNTICPDIVVMRNGKIGIPDLNKRPSNETAKPLKLFKSIKPKIVKGYGPKLIPQNPIHVKGKPIVLQKSQLKEFKKNRKRIVKVGDKFLLMDQLDAEVDSTDTGKCEIQPMRKKSDTYYDSSDDEPLSKKAKRKNELLRGDSQKEDPREIQEEQDISDKLPAIYDSVEDNPSFGVPHDMDATNFDSELNTELQQLPFGSNESDNEQEMCILGV